MKKVALLAIDQMLSSSAAIALEILEATRAQLLAKRDARAQFSVLLVAQEKQPVTMLGGFELYPHCTLDEVGVCDLIIVPALWRNPKKQLRTHPQAVAWLKAQYLAGASLVAVGTGVCLLAESGLLDGKAATTHWHYLEQFAKDYPRVNLQKDYLLTQAGRIFCAASVNSGTDLMVHVIALAFGRELALKVEQQFSPEVRGSFSKNVFYSGSAAHPDEAISLLQAQVAQNLAQPFSLTKLAELAELSTRQLNRRFLAATGLTPTAYVQNLRIEKAKELLKETNLSIAEIAQQLGYLEANYFSRLFHRHALQRPSEYRQKVRAKLFS